MPDYFIGGARKSAGGTREGVGYAREGAGGVREGARVSVREGARGGVREDAIWRSRKLLLGDSSKWRGRKRLSDRRGHFRRSRSHMVRWIRRQ